MSKILGFHTPQDGRNLLLNPEFWLFQRTAPSTPTARTNTQYGPDRWKMLMENTGVNISRSTTAPARAQYAFLLAKSTSTGRMGMIQILESNESVSLRGKTVTFQIAAQSPSSNVSQLRVALLSWTGTADSVTADPISSWAASPTYAANFTQLAVTEASLTNAYSQLSVSAQVPGSCNNLIVFVWTPNQEASGDSVLLSASTLQLGATAGIFSRRNNTDELEGCQRFFSKSYSADVAPGAVTSSGVIRLRATTAGQIQSIAFPVSMRAAPTLTVYNPTTGASGTWRDISAGTDKTTTDEGVSGTDRGAVSAASAVAANAIDGHFTAEAEL